MKILKLSLALTENFKIYTKIISQCRQYLSHSGVVALEHGCGMGPGVVKIGKLYNFQALLNFMMNKGFGGQHVFYKSSKQTTVLFSLQIKTVLTVIT